MVTVRLLIVTLLCFAAQCPVKGQLSDSRLVTIGFGPYSWDHFFRNDSLHYFTANTAPHANVYESGDYEDMEVICRVGLFGQFVQTRTTPENPDSTIQHVIRMLRSQVEAGRMDSSVAAERIRGIKSGLHPVFELKPDSGDIYPAKLGISAFDSASGQLHITIPEVLPLEAPFAIQLYHYDSMLWEDSFSKPTRNLSVPFTEATYRGRYGPWLIRLAGSGNRYFGGFIRWESVGWKFYQPD